MKPCPFCEELKYKPRTKMFDDPNQEREFIPGHWGALYQGVDSNNRPYLIGVGDDYSARFYPRYCPICGKNLDIAFPAPEDEGDYAYRDYTPPKKES